MAHEERSILIERPINEVFDFLLDGMNNPLWRTSVTDCQPVPGKPNTYKQGMKGPGGRLDTDYEVTDITPNQSITMQQIAGMVKPTGRYTLDADGTATRVTYSLTFEAKGPAKMLEPIAAKIMRAEVGMLANLKAHLEQPGQ